MGRLSNWLARRIVNPVPNRTWGFESLSAWFGIERVGSSVDYSIGLLTRWSGVRISPDPY